MSRDDRDQTIATLERDLHRARCDLADEQAAHQHTRDRLARTEARARAWRRVAEWIHQLVQESDHGP